jgi:hypothetical protein
MSKLQSEIQQIKEEKARRKEWGQKAYINRRAKLKADKQVPGLHLFNPKKYACWMFPAWKPENI